MNIRKCDRVKKTRMFHLMLSVVVSISLICGTKVLEVQAATQYNFSWISTTRAWNSGKSVYKINRQVLTIDPDDSGDAATITCIAPAGYEFTAIPEAPTVDVRYGGIVYSTPTVSSAEVIDGTIVLTLDEADAAGLYNYETRNTSGYTLTIIFPLDNLPGYQEVGAVSFIAVTGITDVPETAVAGEQLTLSGSVLPGDATNRTIEWSVADAGTTGAQITGNQLLAAAQGEVTVTATIRNGATESTPYTQDFDITITDPGAPDPGDPDPGDEDLDGIISRITASPDVLSSGGGSSTITVNGSNLPGMLMVKAFDENGNGTDIMDAIVGDDGDSDGSTATVSNAQTATGSNAESSSETFTLRFPENTSTAKDNVYTIKASQDNGDSWSTEKVTVTVQKQSSSKTRSSGRARYGSSASNATGGGSGSWNADSKGWRYRALNGGWLADQWQQLTYNGRNAWYYFGTDTYMASGWLEWKGNKYYLHVDSDGTKGHMYTGWHEIDGTWYYFNTEPGAAEGELLSGMTPPDHYQAGGNGAGTQ